LVRAFCIRVMASVRMLGSLDDAEDIVQEVFLQAWRAPGDFEGRSSVRTWLYRIATHARLGQRNPRSPSSG
jgi:RNA polymerase sigma-70 factor (ECF subfamily)